MEDTASIAAAAVASLSRDHDEAEENDNNHNGKNETGAAAMALSDEQEDHHHDDDDDDDDVLVRRIPSIESDDHPLKRLVLPHEGHAVAYTENHNLNTHGLPSVNNNNHTYGSSNNIFHKRSQSDTATLLLEQDNNNNTTNHNSTDSGDQAAIAHHAYHHHSSGLHRHHHHHHHSKHYQYQQPDQQQQQQQQGVGVTFADTPTAGIQTFNGKLARRRHSASGSSFAASNHRHPTTNSNNNMSQHPPSPLPPAPLNVLPARGRVYRSSIAADKLTTRDIAALDFLLGIPLEAEEAIVHHGWMLQQRRKFQSKRVGVDDDDDDDDDDEDYDNEDYDNEQNETKRTEDDVLLEPPTTMTSTAIPSIPTNSHHGRWWEKWIPGEQTNKNRKNNNANHHPTGSPAANHGKRQHDDVELERPTVVLHGELSPGATLHHHGGGTPTTDTGTPSTNTPGGTNNAHSHNVRTGKSQYNMEPVAVSAPVYAPGRRLEGDEAVHVQIPLTIDTVTRQKSIARQAAIREWELQVAHGLGGNGNGNNQQSTMSTSRISEPNQQQQQQQRTPLLDGRLFFSAAGSYPMAVFSLKRYEPKREEAALRRQKLEARGGGGSHFVMPSRDWRGISYRALLPRKAAQARNQKAFNRFLRNSKVKAANKGSSPSKKRRSQHGKKGDDDDSDDSDNENSNIIDEDDDDSFSSSSDDSSTISNASSEDSYIPGILDDPEMTLGRHRNVMIGDGVTGCIVASTIQFVKPALLKADLNQKFRERFDGWEPNKSQRKYIGARVIDGMYTLVDPSDDVAAANSEHQGSEDSAQPAIVRMPPSLTLSKIRSVKHQALMAFVKAKLEIGTVALACVYFERLCLSCRVDKTNRRLCFAACILLASKINEPNEVLVMKEDNASGPDSGTEDNTNARKKIKRLQSSIRPSKRSSSMFASLLEFFTQDWSLSLKHLFAAEWGVFAALRFSLHASPSQVAFHFKRLMKTLEWDPLHYLGTEMYNQWGVALATEEKRRLERERRRERRRIRKERRIQRELEKEVMRSKQLVETELLRKRNTKGGSNKQPSSVQSASQRTKSDPKNPLSPKRGDDRKKSLLGRPVKQEPIASGNVEFSPSETTDTLLGRRGVIRSLSAKSGGHNGTSDSNISPKRERLSMQSTAPGSSGGKKPRPIKLLHRLGRHRRPASGVKLNQLEDVSDEPLGGGSEKGSPTKKARESVVGLSMSPSMPMLALMPDDTKGPDSQSKQGTDGRGGEDTEQKQPHVVIEMPPDDQMTLDDDGEVAKVGGDEELGETSSVNHGSDAGLMI